MHLSVKISHWNNSASSFQFKCGYLTQIKVIYERIAHSHDGKNA